MGVGKGCETRLVVRGNCMCGRRKDGLLKKLGEGHCSRSLEAQERILLNRPKEEGRSQKCTQVRGNTLS